MWKYWSMQSGILLGRNSSFFFFLWCVYIKTPLLPLMLNYSPSNVRLSFSVVTVSFSLSSFNPLSQKESWMHKKLLQCALKHVYWWSTYSAIMDSTMQDHEVPLFTASLSRECNERTHWGNAKADAFGWLLLFLFGKDRGMNLPWDSPTEVRWVTPGRNWNFFLFFLFFYFFF